MVRLTTYCLLAVLVAPALNLPTPCYTEETRLLHSIGLGHLPHKFDPAHGRSFLHTLPKPSCLLSRPFWTFGKPQRVHLLQVLLS